MRRKKKEVPKEEGAPEKKEKQEKEVKKESREIKKEKKPVAKSYNGPLLGVLAIVAILIIAGAIVLVQNNGGKGTAYVAPNVAANKLTTWLKNYFAARGLPIEAKVVGVKDLGTVYEVNLLLSAQGKTQPVTYYVSKDAKYFFPIGIEMKPIGKVELSKPPKSKKPNVELFVMSYCPYGVQMEKALIPVLNLLGNKINFSLHFVNYAMHGPQEVWENARQYCIQKLFGREVLLKYLDCFDKTNVSGITSASEYYKKLEEASKNCIKELNIDENKLNACVEELNKEYNLWEIVNNRATWISGRFPPFPVEDNLNAKYGVQGSPTLIINGVKVNVVRSPEALKEAICSAFENPPAECNQTLSSQQTSPGFGEGTGSSSAGQCG